MSISDGKKKGKRRGIISYDKTKCHYLIYKMNTKEYKHIQDTKKGTHQTMLRKTNS